MTIKNFHPLSFDWDDVETKRINGETGFTITKIKLVGKITIRHIEYSKTYSADHWCEKGHIIYVISGELLIEHIDKNIHKLKNGMSYFIGDNTLSHKVKSRQGAKVLIVD